MRSINVRLRLITAACVLLVVGCAPAYHSYSGCRINCRYCPPSPLAYPQYCEGQCHSCAASEYLVAENVVSELTFVEGGTVEEAEADGLPSGSTTRSAKGDDAL